AKDSAQTRSTAAAYRRGEEGSGPRLRLREDSASPEGSGCHTLDIHVSHRQGEAQGCRAARWTLSAAQQSHRRRPCGAVDPLCAVDADRERVSIPEERTGHSAHLSSTRTPRRCPCAHRLPCILPAGDAEEPADDPCTRSDAGIGVRKTFHYSDGGGVDSAAGRPLAGTATRHTAGDRCAGIDDADPRHTPASAPTANQVLAPTARFASAAMLPFSGWWVRFQRERGRRDMRWTALESKMLSAAAYEDSKQILYLRFRNTGDVYRYFE